MSSYVLVHGAWMGAFAWKEIGPRLIAQGHSVIVPELPAHGNDQTPATAVSLKSYCDTVIAAIGDQQEIVLVGHSFGGMIISAVAEAIPQQLKRLVYLAAYLPRNGESLYQLSQEDTASHVGRYWRQDDPTQYSPASIAAEGIIEVFGADCPPAYQAMLIERHRAEPVPPLATPVTLSDAHANRVARAYIETVQDNAVSHQLQQLMLSRTPVAQRFQLAAAHSPFFSVPEQVSQILTQLA